MEAQLTHGDWEVESIDGVDDKQGVVYFSANEGDWRQRNEYAVGLDGQNFHRISKQDGTHSADFDPKNTKYYVDDYLGADHAATALRCARLTEAAPRSGKPRSVEAYNLLTPKFVDFKAADGTTTLQGAILLPAGGPMMANGKVPADRESLWRAGSADDTQCVARRRSLRSDPGAPGIRRVARRQSRHGESRQSFRAAHQTPFRPDRIERSGGCVKQALQQFPQLDGNRLGFWGWSYGGYFTLYALEHSDHVQVGRCRWRPVSNWLLYDSIYTERYMGLPKDNPEGYKDSSPVNFAGDLHGSLLEVHGTSDDNVHMQNTIQMVNNFIDAGKQFELMLYPRKTHGIAGKAARTHLFHLIDNHFLETLAPGK